MCFFKAQDLFNSMINVKFGFHSSITKILFINIQKLQDFIIFQISSYLIIQYMHLIRKLTIERSVMDLEIFSYQLFIFTIVSIKCIFMGKFQKIEVDLKSTTQFHLFKRICLPITLKRLIFNIFEIYLLCIEYFLRGT